MRLIVCKKTSKQGGQGSNMGCISIGKRTAIGGIYNYFIHFS
jgi:hypothetical protein